MILLIAAALAAPKMERQVIDVDGKKRGALVYKPDGVRKPVVVLAYHGIGGDPASMVKIWKPLAEKHGFMLVMPVQPKPRAWFKENKPPFRNLDLGLFTDWRDWAVKQGADTKKVYVAGFSMGGHFASVVYCSGADIAGLSMLSISMEQRTYARCDPKGPMPIAFMGARRDPFTKAGTVRTPAFTATRVSSRKTENRFGSENRCTQRIKRKKGAIKYFRGRCAAPFVRVKLPGAAHTPLRSDFNPAGFSWRTWKP